MQKAIHMLTSFSSLSSVRNRQALEPTCIFKVILPIEQLDTFPNICLTPSSQIELKHGVAIETLA